MCNLKFKRKRGQTRNWGTTTLFSHSGKAFRKLFLYHKLPESYFFSRNSPQTLFSHPGKASRKLFLYQKLPESYFFSRNSSQKAISLPKASRKLFIYQEKLSESYFVTRIFFTFTEGFFTKTPLQKDSRIQEKLPESYFRPPPKINCFHVYSIT